MTTSADDIHCCPCSSGRPPDQVLAQEDFLTLYLQCSFCNVTSKDLYPRHSSRQRLRTTLFSQSFLKLSLSGLDMDLSFLPYYSAILGLGGMQRPQRKWIDRPHYEYPLTPDVTGILDTVHATVMNRIDHLWLNVYRNASYYEHMPREALSGGRVQTTRTHVMTVVKFTDTAPRGSWRQSNL